MEFHDKLGQVNRNKKKAISPLFEKKKKVYVPNEKGGQKSRHMTRVSVAQSVATGLLVTSDFLSLLS